MQIHWHEGLFLLPHHLQLLQRGAHAGIARERRLTMPYPYGVVESVVAEEDLENNRITFRSLRCVFPSGRTVDFPENSDLPSRSFQNELQRDNEVIISVALPLWKDHRPNVAVEDEASAQQNKMLFRIRETNYCDENTGDNPKAVLERVTSARLLFQGEDESDMEVLPLLRIVRDAGEDLGRPRQDTGFSGPCLLLGGSETLRQIVQSIIGEIEASRQEVSLLINRGGFNIQAMRGMQFEQLLRLQCLSRAVAQLRLRRDYPAIEPVEIYGLLLELLFELTALHPDEDEPTHLPYEHERPVFCFQRLNERLRFFLRGAGQAGYLKLPFYQSEGFLQVTLAAEHFAAPADFYLGIISREDPVELARLVQNEDRFKLTPLSLASRAVRGILLQEERFPPMELPVQNNLYFFRLRPAECPEIWSRVEKENCLTARWSGDDRGNFELALYIIRQKP